MAKYALAVLLVAGCSSLNAPEGPSAASGVKRWSAEKQRHSRVAHARPRRGSLPAASRSQLRASIAHDWTGVAHCDSTNNPRANTGNGYYGLLQMDETFWRNYGGLRFAARPDLASRAEQITVAERGLAVQGVGAWPVCGRFLLPVTEVR